MIAGVFASAGPLLALEAHAWHTRKPAASVCLNLVSAIACVGRIVWATAIRLWAGYGTLRDPPRPVRWTQASTALVGGDGGVVRA